jgi:hypothetical protein
LETPTPRTRRRRFTLHRNGPLCQESPMNYETPTVIEEAILAQVTGNNGPTGDDA